MKAIESAGYFRPFTKYISSKALRLVETVIHSSKGVCCSKELLAHKPAPSTKRGTHSGYIRIYFPSPLNPVSCHYHRSNAEREFM